MVCVRRGCWAAYQQARCSPYSSIGRLFRRSGPSQGSTCAVRAEVHVWFRVCESSHQGATPTPTASVWVSDTVVVIWVNTGAHEVNYATSIMRAPVLHTILDYCQW